MIEGEVKDSLGDRIKRYERAYDHMLTPNSWVLIRVDGKAFHTWTKGMNRPFDSRLINAMQIAAQQTARELQGFRLAYTQSDEATFLITDTGSFDDQGWFGFSLNKLVSVSASAFTAFFNQEARWWNSDAGAPAMFDSRVFVVPYDDVPNVFVWRQKDWLRNSVQMFARAHFSHGDLKGKSIPDVHEMLHFTGLNWAHLAPVVKNGTFITPDGKFICEGLDYYGIKSLIDTGAVPVL